MTKTAFITGITGQDGSYLTEHLLAHGYIVHGLVRRNSNTVRSRIDHLTRDESIYGQTLFLHYGDLDSRDHDPPHTGQDETRRSVPLSRPEPRRSNLVDPRVCELTAMGTLWFLEILRDCAPQPKFAHASSSEIFGEPDAAPQNEDTPMRPMTPYGVAKVTSELNVPLKAGGVGDSAPSIGGLRFNTITQKLEVSNGEIWVAVH